MRWRSGSSSRSSCRRRSSLARSLAVRSSYSLRLAPRACSRSSLSASAFCRPAWAAASVRRDQFVRGALLPRRRSTRPAARRFRWRACSSAWRACQAAQRERALPAPGAPGCAAARGDSVSLRSASITRSSSWAWRSWLSASCMSSSSKRAFGRDAALLQVVQLGVDFGQVAGDLLAAGAGLFGQLRQAQGLDLQLVGAALALRRLRGAPSPGAARHRHRPLRRAPGRCAPRRRSAPGPRSCFSRFSISWARASRPACSESCA